MKHIYVYTTPLYESRNWYKIGETIQDPNGRVRSQDNASNPEQLIFVHSWKVPSNVTDFKVHKKLEQLGFDRIRREWFELSEKPIVDISTALSQLIPTQVFELKDNITIPNYTEMWWFKNILPPC